MLIIGISVLCCCVIFYCFFEKSHRNEIGIAIDKLGITQNQIKFVTIPEDIKYSNAINIYWKGETAIDSVQNSILLYHRGIKQADMPSAYGKNRLIIQIGDICLDRIGIFKKEAFSKHNYDIKMFLEKDTLFISWNIGNWYNSNIIEGSESIPFDISKIPIPITIN